MQRLVVLVLLMSSVVNEFAHANFSCSEFSSQTCNCISHPPIEYRVQCPPANIQIKRGKLVQVDCNLTSSGSPELPPLHIGDVDKFILRFCILPEKSIRDFMADIGITKITELQIQSSVIPNVILEKKHLEKLYDVTKLILSNNGLTSLPTDLFEDMGNLTFLDMKRNNIDFPKDIFNFTQKLETLELGKNNLTYLEPGIFKNLKQLKLLNLWGNKLTNLTKAVFSDLPNLDSLDLHSNKMKTIRADLFEGLTKLKKLSLHSNDFVSLPQGLLSKNTNLEEFLMHENNRSLASLPRGFLSNLTYLKKVSLKNNKLLSLPEDAFSGSRNIQELYLNQNSLTTLETKTFFDLEQLKYLDLSGNQIIYLPEELFSKTRSLVNLKLHHNLIKEIPPLLFLQLSSLEHMDLRFNMIKEIRGEQFYNLEKLRSLDISDNQLTTLALSDAQIPDFGNNSVLHNCKYLEDLQLANNSLTEIYGDWRLSFNNLRTLNLAFNHLHSVEINDLQFLGDVSIDLSNNMISFVNFWAAEILALSNLQSFTSTNDRDFKSKRKQLKIDNNPFNCDCQLLKFVQFVQENLSPEVQDLLDISANNLKCHEPKFLKDELLKEVPLGLLTCEFSNSESYMCPTNCTCLFRPSNKGNIITCQNASLRRIPSSLPNYENATHTELHLESNHLQSFKIPENSGYENVTHFYLSKNNITSFHISGISNKIKVLDMSNNNMSTLTADAISFLENISSTPDLEKLALYGNHWQCDCEAKPLIRMLRNRFNQVNQFPKVKCSNGTNVEDLQEVELCPQTVGFIIIICVICAVLGFLVAVTTTLYYHYEKEIHIYCFSSKWKLLRWLVSRPDVDEDKLYDAFISFPNEHFSFVSEQLVPELEVNGGRNFKLCLHYRDWAPGESIPNQILYSVKNSRRTIVVLSPAFLKSMWGQLEFKTAVVEALKDGTARVIVILYEDVGPIDDLDEEFRAYLKMNTYVKWGSPWFWQQLYYAMPHPPEDDDDIQCVFSCFPKITHDSSIHKILKNVRIRNGDVHYIPDISENVTDKKFSSFNKSAPLIIEDSIPIQFPPKYNKNGSALVNI